MDFLVDSVLIGFALAMDCLAVSIATGADLKAHRVKAVILLAGIFGFSQFGMAITGWLLGSGFTSVISAYDHWIAAFLLFVIGMKMMVEGIHNEGEEEPPDIFNFAIIIPVAIATSIDSLAVGISFAFLGIFPIIPAIIIGSITAAVSAIGVIAGGKAGQVLGERIDILGGIILILIGIRIVIEHTM